MIPRLNIIAWTAQAPWPELRQVEQDLIICRALVAVFSDPFLSGELRFRGGTALNKLHFQSPLRYSEDIDLVRTSMGGIGPILDGLRDVLEPWLGRGQFEQSEVAPKLRFRVPAEDGGVIRLKLEINTREIEAFDSHQTIDFTVANPWFTGSARISTFSREELLATKLRALLQRDKGRDLIDLAYALTSFPELNRQRIVECFCLYLDGGGQVISRAMAEQRMFAKLASSSVITDIRPLFPTEVADLLTDAYIKQAFTSVLYEIIALLPGAPWGKREEMIERFGIISNN